MSKVVIIGAGLAGSLLSIYLARRGFEVEVYEARGDMRREEVAAGRSINLALSDRGIRALREVGMDEYMLAEAVPMYGRMIHSPTGDTKLLPYSGREGEYINSVSRAGLNIALMNEAEKYPSVRFSFERKCVDLDVSTGEAILANGERIGGDTVIATDGAGSAVRQAMDRQVGGFASSSVFLDHGYKELHIPPAPGGGFLLEKNALHIWPRHQFMMIALPNFDGSFTCTLFLARSEPPASAGGQFAGQETAAGLDQVPPVWPPVYAGGSDFDSLADETSLLGFFNREFPDAVPLMPTLVEDFFHNPTGELGTLKCWPWHAGGKVLLLGDAAHAMVPFYGQGMNCAFEDVRVLAEHLSEPPAPLLPEEGWHRFGDGVAGATGGQSGWDQVFEEYSRLRKPNTDAIQDMAEENFYEMRDRVADPVFQRKRELETRLEYSVPDYFSKYSMVTFREDLPYSTAKKLGNAQDEMLLELCAEVDDLSQIDLDALMERVRELHRALS